ncbi:MAG: NUDIX hydrolase [Erysipelotrichaceae bacterium]|nr:NUDIX hydrolase [Erysipelotrichaceae bacterium]
MNIYGEIKRYQPYNIQEEKDKRIILEFLDRYEDAFERSNELAHMTSSAWVVNHEKNKVLMAYHRIYDSWAWLGGHCDGNRDCLAVAMKEVKEEAGVKTVRPVSDEIFSLEVLSVDSHYKRGNYVPTHLHLNVTYLLEADENEKLQVKEDENSNVAWFGLGEAVEKSNEKWFRENIYTKLNKKLREIYYEND